MITGRPVTGTEWEFEDAVASYRNRSLPDLLLHRKRAQIPVFLDDDVVQEQQRQQKRMVEDFVQRWFVDSNAATFKAASREFSVAARRDLVWPNNCSVGLRQRLNPPKLR
jgi:hypothetical protein